MAPQPIARYVLYLQLSSENINLGVGVVFISLRDHYNISTTIIVKLIQQETNLFAHIIHHKVC